MEARPFHFTSNKIYLKMYCIMSFSNLIQHKLYTNASIKLMKRSCKNFKKPVVVHYYLFYGKNKKCTLQALEMEYVMDFLKKAKYLTMISLK